MYLLISEQIWDGQILSQSCLFVITIIGLIVFINVEKRKKIVLVDFAVFKNKPILVRLFPISYLMP